MNVVPKEPRHAPPQALRVAGQALAPGIHFWHVMLGTDRNRTEGSWVGVGCALVIHRHIEETRTTQGFARGLDLFQVAAEGFFTLVEAEHGLERWWCLKVVRCMMDKGVIDAMTDRSFEGLVQDSSLANAVEFAQLGFQIRYVRSGPLLHNYRIETAKLCHMKERPRALHHGRTRRNRQPALQGASQV